MNTDSLVTQLRQDGFCRLDNVVAPEVALDCYYDAFRVLATCGIIAPAYSHNASWQLRALELMEDVINPARHDSILEEQFYVRPAANRDMQSFTPYLTAPRVTEFIEARLGAEARVTFSTLYVHEPGTQRGTWHTGGPFNPDFAAHYPAPYGESAPHLTLHLLLSDFTNENGGLLAVPGSHRRTTNPGYLPRAERFETYPDEANLTGAAGSVIVMDSRLWHAIAENPFDFPRASIVVEIAPSA